MYVPGEEKERGREGGDGSQEKVYPVTRADVLGADQDMVTSLSPFITWTFSGTPGPGSKIPACDGIYTNITES